jgi:general secretion pathway protein F
LPLYTYKGIDAASGANKKGKIEAESAKAARMKLKQKFRIIVSDLHEEAPVKSTKKASRLFGSKVSKNEIAVMTRQFATLQQAHVPLDESIRALTDQVENIVLRNTLSAIKDDISEGKSLGDSMSNYPGVFDRLYVNMVKAGESSGNLGVVLERLADFIEYQVKTQGQLMSAMAYPAIMMVASGGIIAFLFVSIVPKLQKVFKSLKVDLPWYSKMLIGFSEFVQNHWFLILCFMGAVAAAFRYWKSSESGKRRWDAFILKAPIFGPVVMRTNVSNFTRTLSTLLSSGVPIINALTITKNTINNSVIADVVENSKIAVQEGEGLGVTIEKSGQFPGLVTHMIKTGEQTGEIEQMLKHVADAYETEVERRIETMISLIEPLMIIVMGGVAVVVVAALMIPMLSVMSKIR